LPDAMRNHVCGDHTAMQLKLKNHSSTIALQLLPPSVTLMQLHFINTMI
jgi:hypothetical protein